MSVLLRILVVFSSLFKKIRKIIRRFDQKMRKHYHPRQLALLTVGVIALLMSIMLFIPPYLGLSNDGSFDNVLADVGLAKLDGQSEDAYFNYYERLYAIDSGTYRPNVTPMLLKACVSIAKAVDVVLTGDNIFDMRFLALIYLAAYLAALYPFISWLLRRVRSYSEGIFMAVLSVLVFADVSIATRFASLYTQALEWILMLIVLDLLLGAVKYRGQNIGTYAIAVPIILLMYLNDYFALAGIIFSLVYWRLAMLKSGAASKALKILFALTLCVFSVTCIGNLDATRTKNQHYNQMTRGVLFQSSNPEIALAQFGIEPRYSILTETYADQQYPVVLPESGVLDEEFLNRYRTGDVLIYYAQNPGAVLNLLNIGVHSAFITRSDYSGNYEQSAGMPPRSKSLFMSAWSGFKDRTAPKTIGFVVLLVLGLVLLSRRKTKDKEGTRVSDAKLLRGLIGVFFFFAAAELATVVIYTGDSELIRESYLMGICIDLLMVLFVSEALHKLDLIGEKEE